MKIRYGNQVHAVEIVQRSWFPKFRIINYDVFDYCNTMYYCWKTLALIIPLGYHENVMPHCVPKSHDTDSGLALTSSTT